MSQDPLLDKMDALLRKHRGGRDAVAATPAAAPEDTKDAAVLAEATAPPPDAWLPVLTDVVVMGEIPEAKVEDAAMEKAKDEEKAIHSETSAVPQASSAAERSMPAAPPLTTSGDAHAVSDTLAEQLMGELEPKLAALLQDKVATQIRNSLDDTVAALLAQLDVNIREIVREAINERLENR